MDKLSIITDFVQAALIAGFSDRRRIAEKDLKNIEAFFEALKKKVPQLPAEDYEPFLEDLKNLVSKVIPSGNFWSWIKFDPFKDFRFTADRFAEKWTLDWKR